MPRAKLTSQRKFQIFSQLEIEGLPVEDVARSFGLSERGIKRIATCVRNNLTREEWEGASAERQKKLGAKAGALKKLMLDRLDSQWRQTMEAWRRSVREERLVHKRVVTKKEEKLHIITQSPKPNLQMLIQARKICNEILKLTCTNE